MNGCYNDESGAEHFLVKSHCLLNLSDKSFFLLLYPPKACKYFGSIHGNTMHTLNKTAARLSFSPLISFTIEPTYKSECLESLINKGGYSVGALGARASTGFENSM